MQSRHGLLQLTRSGVAGAQQFQEFCIFAVPLQQDVQVFARHSELPRRHAVRNHAAAQFVVPRVAAQCAFKGVNGALARLSGRDKIVQQHGVAREHASILRHVAEVASQISGRLDSFALCFRLVCQRHNHSGGTPYLKLVEETYHDAEQEKRRKLRVDGLVVEPSLSYWTDTHAGCGAARAA